MATLLIIDAENIKILEEELLFYRFFHEIDKILIYSDMLKNNICKNYVDWCIKYKQCFMNHVPSVSGKNSVDIQISIDLTELSIFNKEIKHIIIATNDRDFLPLCKKLYELNKKVSIIAYQRIHEDLLPYIQNFYFTKDISLELRILLKSFIYYRKEILNLSYVKRYIKKMMKKKKIVDVDNLLQQCLIWKNIFCIDENNNIILTKIDLF